MLVHGGGRHSRLDSEPGKLGTLRYGLGPANVALRGGPLRAARGRLGLVAALGPAAGRALVLVEDGLAARDSQRVLGRRRVVAHARDVEHHRVTLVGRLAGHRAGHGALGRAGSRDDARGPARAARVDSRRAR